MANFTAGTSFTDGVTNDVTSAKLNALIADAVPTANLSLNSTTGTIANFTSSTVNATLGTIPSLTAGTTTSTAANITTGTIPTLTAGTTTSTAATITTGTITNLSTTLAGDFTISQGTGTIAAGAVTAAKMSNPQYTGFRNKIINGDMVIDQRNAGASVTPTSTSNVFPVDRFVVVVSQDNKLTAQQNAGSVTPAAGFINYLGITSSSSYTVGASDYFTIRQQIEGFNVSDLGWGTANAKTVTLSFQVYSSLTGTFGGALSNSDFSRSYPFSYTISSANTWTSISVTIAGDTTGTWLTNNGIGIRVQFGLGVGSTYSGTAGAWAGALYISSTGAKSVVGTNGATFYITGVQLESGSTATEFERRPYGTELALCQRYCQVIDNSSSIYGTIGYAIGVTTAYVVVNVPLVVAMRTVPSSLTISSNSHFQVSNYNGTWAWSSFSLSSSNCTPITASVEGTTATSGLNVGSIYVGRGNNTTSGKLTFSAEL